MPGSATHTQASAGAQRMARLYCRLGQLGFPDTFVRDYVLPEWWRDDSAQNPAAYAHGAGIIAKSLHLDVRTLLVDGCELAYRPTPVPPRLKTIDGESESKLQPAQFVCVRAAQVACWAAVADTRPLPGTAKEIRAAIQRAGHAVVDLEALVGYCWSVGMPVVYVSQLPRKRLHGLATEYNGRPAVVVSKNSRYSADLAFVLAHEMGHLVLGHVGTGGILGDQGIQQDSRDEQEQDANWFATELLTGKPHVRYTAPYNLTAVQLAQSARQVAQQEGVDPGVVALNYAWHRGQWGAGMAALKIIEPDANAPTTICSAMLRELDLQRLNPDSRGFLLRVTVGGSGSHDLPGGHRPSP